MEDCIATLLKGIGEDPDREGLQDTPKRVVKALRELTAGYHESPQDILSTQFTENADEMIIVKGIPFWSLCEHHMLPFQGTATVAYLPRTKVVGLSKIPRLVHCFARRLQVQERLTEQIAGELFRTLNAVGAACLIESQHTCMMMRGIKSHGSMVTSSLLGAFKYDPQTRNEFLSLAKQ